MNTKELSLAVLVNAKSKAVIYSWTFIKRPPAPAADLGKMLTNFLNACSGKGEGGGGEGR